ncbi:hypothetical protein [Paenibacillus planticolens]|uniref:EamA domain-containing protein n=1 Tax=Paenibacillus planticolens TaxID=2654976 RepID=A0ABX1ZEY2_9BACL|nr:hypothetical protein [Paenibacillus planticolens]NOU98659.1 hypothetical protein [Paenibacillus planticolens]
MYGLLTAVAAALLVGQSLILKLFRGHARGGHGDNFAFHASYSLFIAVGFAGYAFLSGHHHFSPVTLIVGTCFGVIFVLTMFVYSSAMDSGPLSYSTFYFSSSMLLPVVVSVLLWHESLGLWKIIGIGLFLISFYCISILGKGVSQKPRPIWYLYCVLAFLLNGALSVCSKFHQSQLGGGEVIEYMTVSFATATIAAALGMLIFRPQKASFVSLTTTSWPYTLGVAVTTGGANAIIAFLSGKMSGVLLFPIVNGSMIVSISLLSFILFKERVSKFGVAGMMTGLIAIIAISVG